MKKRFIFLFLIICLLSFSKGLHANYGKRFWASVGHFPEIKFVEPYIVLVSEKATEVKIENPNTGWEKTVRLNAYSYDTIFIPSDHILVNKNNTVMSRSVLITASENINVYFYMFRDTSMDAVSIRPEEKLSDEYIIQNYNFFSPDPSRMDDFILIVATEDKTTIDIVSPVDIYEGAPALTPFTIQLNKGEAYQAFAEIATTADNEENGLSGTYVKSRENKKIAVYAGNLGFTVPRGGEGGIGGGGSENFGYEQMTPLSEYGNEFIIVRSYQQTMNRIRITASTDNTEIFRNNSLIAGINAYESYEMEIAYPEESCYIRTSALCLVQQYFMSQSYTKYGRENYGDPSISYVPPLNKMVSHANFAVLPKKFTDSRIYSFPEDPALKITRHFLSIITKTDEINCIRLDGEPITQYFKPIKGNPLYSYAYMNMNEGYHNLRNQEGFIAYQYGAGKLPSYYTSLGASDGEETPSNVLEVGIENTHEICADDEDFTIRFTVSTGEVSHYSLHFDDKALERGFTDVEYRTLDKTNEITIVIPENILPDIYNATLYFYDLCGSYKAVPLEFTINYPASILEQKWKDVIAVLNERYNGGYTFSQFQWYVNDNPINGQTGSNLYIHEGLQLGAEYRALLTRTSDNVTLLTCPFIPMDLSFELNVIQEPDISSYKNVLTITVEQDYDAVIWNEMGLKMGDLKLKAGKNEFTLNYPPGMYIIEILDFNGKSFYRRFIIR